MKTTHAVWDSRESDWGYSVLVAAFGAGGLA
jgi:hypothetical protein